jgi:hypothetical protein
LKEIQAAVGGGKKADDKMKAISTKCFKHHLGNEGCPTGGMI